MRKIIAIIVAALVAAACLGTTSAEAKVAAAGMPNASLPYVTDVNPSARNLYVATVECAGSGKSFEFQAVCKGKRAKVKRIGKRAWSVKIRRGELYKLSVRAKGGKWKSIGYRVY